MNQVVNDIYRSAFTPELKNHILNDMGFSKEDKKIIVSLMEHDADSNFHYDNTGIGRGKFERRLNNINRIVFPELIRLSNNQLRG